MVGEDDLPGQWDDELSRWPDERRHLAAKRIAFVTVCGVLVTLIILTIVLVGNDKTSSAQVTTNGTSTSTLGTIGFATSLPVAATATSFGTTTSSTTSTSTTTTTNPRQNTTTSSTTTTVPPFQYNPAGPKNASAEYAPPGPPGCQPSNGVNITFNTPTPGHISINRTGGPNVPATGLVQPNGDFDATVTSGGETDHYVGNTTQTGATGTLTITSPPAGACPAGASYPATWTFA